MIPPGCVLKGQFRIFKSKLGTGGMGIVSLGTNIKNGKSVAIKCPKPEYLTNQRTVERFLESCRIASKLKHENICEVIDYGTRDGIPYLVMPYVEGDPLGSLLKKRKILPIDRATDIATQVLAGLEVAHKMGVIHRDIKPSNIIFDKSAGRNKATILDFGISKVLDSNTRLTQTGTVLGTPYYMAPEQASGSKDADHRVDIYAVGGLLYEMLTARRPYDDCTPEEVGSKLVSAQSFDQPRLLNPEISEALEGVILAAMRRDPTLRYSSADEMRESLINVSMITKDSTDKSLTRKTTQTLIPTLRD